MVEPRISSPARSRTTLHAGARATALGMVFLCAFVAAVILHLDTPCMRRVATNVINWSLSGLFCGKLTLERIGQLRPSGISGARVLVDDPEGHRIVLVNGLNAHVALLSTLQSVLFDPEAYLVDIADVSIKDVDLALETDSAQRFNLERTFQLRSAPSSTRSGRDVKLSLRRILVSNASTHLSILEAPAFDANVDELQATLALVPGKLTIDVGRLAIKTRGIPERADATGNGSIRLEIPLPNTPGLAADIHWAGAIAGVPVSADFRWTDGNLQMAVDAPQIPAAAVRSLWPGYPSDQVASVQAELRGSLPELTIRARVSLGSSALDISGPVVWADQKRADLQLVADSIDIEQLVTGAPRAHFVVSGDLSAVRSPTGLIGGEANLEISQGSVAGFALSPASIRATFDHDPGVSSRVVATLVAHEVGAKAALRCQLTSKADSAAVAFAGNFQVPRLDFVSRLRRFGQGSAVGDLQGRIDLSRGTLNARLGLEAAALVRKNLSIGKVSVQAELQGSIKAPNIELKVKGSNIDAFGASFSDALVTAKGPLSATRVIANLRVADGSMIRAHGLLGLGKTAVVHDLSVLLDRGNGSVSVRADIVRIRGERVDVDRAVIEGLGEPVYASATAAPRELRVRAKAHRLDLSRVANLVQIDGLGGQLAVDVDLALSPKLANGHASLGLTDASFAQYRGWSARAEANLEGRHVTGHFRGEYGGTSWIDLRTTSLELGGAAAELKSWGHWRGGFGIDAHTDIANLVRMLPPEVLPLDQMQGEVAVQGQLMRETAGGPLANVEFALHGTGLGFTLKGKAASDRRQMESSSEASPQFHGIDTDFGLDVDGGSGATRITWRVSDGKGDLVTLDATAGSLPFGALLSSPREIPLRLKSIPLSVHLVVPRRNLNSLPGGLLPKRYRGDFGAELEMTGTPLNPSVTLAAKLADGRLAATGIYLPVALSLQARYDGTHADGNLKVQVDRHEVLVTEGQVDLRAADWLSFPDHGAVPWEASAHARLSGFPLDGIRALSDSQIRGGLNGELWLDGLHRDAHAKVMLEAKDLRIRELAMSNSAVQVTVDRHALNARARLDQDAAFAEVQLSAASKWGTALFPALDDSRPLVATVNAQRFRVSTLLPLVEGIFSELDGRIDAKARIELDRRAGSAHLTGDASLTGGLFELEAGGGEFHDISAKLTVTPDGVVRLEDVSAQGMSGKMQGAASAHFDGFGLASADAHLQVPASHPIPLTLEGAGYGTVDGRVDALAARSPDRKEVDVNIDVPSLHVGIPTASARSVQHLGAIQNVRVGSRQRNDKFVPLTVPRKSAQTAGGATRAPTKLKVSVNLGQDVEVRRGEDLNVTLTGRPQIIVGDTTSVSGQVRLVRGTLDVQGKRFEIEQGTITFLGDDPSNPQAVITAAWSAPEGTRVYAEFTGPLKSGKVTLRSEPPLPKNEILALMLFGSSDGLAGHSATGSNASGSGAVGVAQGTATQPLNHALQEYGLGGISARVDTSTNNPRPEVDIQIARDIALQIAWVLGTPPPGSNPDKTLFTLDWRFFRKWSLETTVGDAGTSIADLIWQYRY
jgi:translocation and assembly module TamB